MPEVQEAFRMATQKVRPDEGFVDRQLGRQRRRTRNRRFGTLALVAALGIAATIGVILGAKGGPDATSPAEPGAEESPRVNRATNSPPFFLDLRTGVRTPLADTLVPEGAGAGVHVNYSVSPDGSAVAFSTCLGFSCSGVDVMRLGDIDGTNVRTLGVPSGLNGYLPRWSPDGSQLVYQVRSGATNEVGNVFLYDFSSGRRTQLTDLDLHVADWWFLSARFTPDGQDVIFHLPRDSSGLTKWDAWSVPVTGGEPSLMLRDAAFPTYFPRGDALAVVEPKDSSLGGVSLQIAEPQGSRRTLVEANSPPGIWWPEISPDGTRIAYQDGGSIYVVDVATAVSTKVAEGDNAEWLDDHTLIVSP
jgi:Tol biopolymer transport system component